MSIDIIDILSKLNKAALFFFLATVAFLAYEFYLFRKDRAKKSKLKVPQFSTAGASNAPPVVQKMNAAPTPQFSPKPLKRRNNKAIIGIAVSVVTLGLVGLLVFRLNSTTEQDASIAPQNPRAAEETPPTDLTTGNEASSSGQTNDTSTASDSSQLATVTGTITPSVSPDPTLAATESSVLAKTQVTAVPTTEPSRVATTTSTPTPTEVVLATSEATSSAEPTSISELPLTADNTSVPYTLFIFLGAIITFFVAFIY